MANNGFTLFPYQIDTIQKMEDFEGKSLLALEMGVGKTVITLAALSKNRDWLPALIVCPASVKYQWQAEAISKFNLQSDVCEGRTPPKQGFTSDAPLTIINFDILKHWTKHLKKVGYKTLVVDECQFCGNYRSDRTRAVRSLAPGIENRFALSGTPLTQRTKELFPILNILWPEHYKSFWAFAQVYCQARKKPWGWDYSRSRNTDKLNKELTKQGMVRYRKIDVLKDLPKKERYIIPCELSRPEEYLEAQNDFMVYLMKHKAHKIQRAMRSQALFQVGELLRLTAKLKLRYVVDWCNDFLETTNEKLVLVGVHHAALNAFKNHIHAKSVMITGRVRGRKRSQAKEQFLHDKHTRLLIGNIQAMGVGVDGLQKASSKMIVSEIPWRPTDLDQVESRLDRHGQEHEISIFYMVAQNTIEERICSILQEKQGVVNSVLDGGSSPDSFNLYDEVLREFEKGFI